MSTKTIIIFIVLTALSYFFNLHIKLKNICEKKLFNKTGGEEGNEDKNIEENEISPIIINEDNYLNKPIISVKNFNEFHNELDRKNYIESIVNSKGINLEDNYIDLLSSIKLEFDEFMKKQFDEYESEELDTSFVLSRPKKETNFLDEEEPNSDDYL